MRCRRARRRSVGASLSQMNNRIKRTVSEIILRKVSGCVNHAESTTTRHCASGGTTCSSTINRMRFTLCTPRPFKHAMSCTSIDARGANVVGPRRWLPTNMHEPLARAPPPPPPEPGPDARAAACSTARRRAACVTCDCDKARNDPLALNAPLVTLVTPRLRRPPPTASDSSASCGFSN